MQYFNEKNNVDSYIEMAEGYNSYKLIDKLEEYLTPAASVLELGMGPGTDLEYLAKKYDVTGSDLSDEFLRRFRQKFPESKLLKLDAATISTDQKFDCIFSAKVLQHLNKADFRASFKRQTEILTDAGIVLHSLWLGEGTENYDGLFFQYYSAGEVLKTMSMFFEVMDSWTYTEMEKDDSIAVIGRKKNG